MSSLYIYDDEHETVFINIEEKRIASVDHAAYGWAGMREVIDLVETIADSFGIEVFNSQDIV